MDKALFAVRKQKAEKGLGSIALAFPAYLAEHHAVRLSANGACDATIFGHDAFHPCHVFLFDFPLLHGEGKQGAAVGMLGDRQSAAGLSVKASHGAKNEGTVAV